MLSDHILLLFEITYLQEPLSLLEFTSFSSSSSLFQPTFLLFDLCAAMSHHYHEIDGDTCQDRAKEEFSTNSRPWVGEKWGLLLSITALNPRHTFWSVGGAPTSPPPHCDPRKWNRKMLTDVKASPFIRY